MSPSRERHRLPPDWGHIYFPDIELPEEPRPIGKWGHMYLSYLEQTNSLQLNNLILGAVTYVIDKARLSIRLVPPYSEECRQAASEYARRNGYGSGKVSTA